MAQTDTAKQPNLDLARLSSMTVQELHEVAHELEVPEHSQLRKRELIFEILRAQTESKGLIFRSGLLEVLPDGFGFLRIQGYSQSPDDVYVSQSQIKRFGLRTGDEIAGQVRLRRTTSATSVSCISKRSTCTIPRRAGTVPSSRT